jgi:hypothetical protein
MTQKQILFEFVLARCEAEPVATRIALYRSLASYAGEIGQRDELTKLAADLEAADLRCREFAFHFQNRKGGGK